MPELKSAGRRILRTARRLGVSMPARSATIATAKFRAAVTGCPLPPGDFESLFAREVKDRHFLLHRFEELGPVFKGYDWGNLWVCMLGLERCRRFLRENAGRLRMDTIDIRPAVAGGFLRSMEGESHRHYRRALISAIAITQPLADPRGAEAIVAAELAAFAAGAHGRTDPALALRETLRRIAAGILIGVFFGVKPEDPAFQIFYAGYQRLGPNGLVWTVGPDQVAAYSLLREQAEKLAVSGGGGIAGAAARAGTLDETLLGNIVYMVEMGRFDIAGLLCWVTRNLTNHGAYAPVLKAEREEMPDGPRPQATAFARETLRMDQSERLTRYATEELRFDGFLIPRKSRIRLCMWEAHKDPQVFPSPFEFRPERFLDETPGRDRYAPFGIDHHMCPFDEFTVRLCAIFLGVLASNWLPEKLDDGLAVRAHYHWTPSPRFSVKLHPL